MGTITAFFTAVANFFGWSKTRAEEHNTPEMVKAKTAQNEVDAQAKVDQEIATGDVKDLRKDLSE